MLRELYTRTPDDPNYVFGILEHSNTIESIISKVKMIFGTRQGQVFGDLNMGIGLEDLVFESKISANKLEEKIKTQFNQYITESKDFKITPKVQFGRADGYDYCIVDVYIDGQKQIGILVK